MVVRHKWYLKLLVVLVSVVLIGTACTSGGGSGGTDSSSGQTDGSAAPGEDGIEFSYLLITRMINWLEDLKWADEAYERLNANVELVDGGEGNNYYSNVDLRIGGGDFPDAGIVTLAQAEVYGSQGAFLDLKPLIAEHAPNIQRYIDEHPEYEQLITASDGSIYGLIDHYPFVATVLFYRADMFEEAGITEVPRTIEQFTETLRTLKAHYGANNPNFYPYSGREEFYDFVEVFQANDRIENGTVHGIYNNGRYVDIKSEGFREWVEWFAELYSEGLIDPEFVAGAATEQMWESKMLTGEAAMTTDFFTRPAWFMMNGGPENNPDYDIKVMPYLLDENGNQARKAGNPIYSIDRVMVINARAEDKAAEILRFHDYFWSEEGLTLTGWGVEGESYEEVGGEKQFIVDFAAEEAKPLGEKRWSFLNDRLTFAKPIDNEAFYEWNTETVKSFASELFTDEFIVAYPQLKYTTEQLQERSNLVASVMDAIDGNVVNFINGRRPMSEWDDFIQEMVNQGYDRILEIDQEAYDAM